MELDLELVSWGFEESGAGRVGSTPVSLISSFCPLYAVLSQGLETYLVVTVLSTLGNSLWLVASASRLCIGLSYAVLTKVRQKMVLGLHPGNTCGP